MHIHSLYLKNFQKHSDLQIDFVNGVNILYGSSDAGKSCIRRAIEWVIQNESIDGIRKTGTKKTSVCITLDNDIQIERIRSQAINRYIIREGKEEQKFDAIGKLIPDEVKKVLKIYPIEVDGEEIYLNSHAQIALPFLFDKSASFRMKLFNQLTGNDVLDKLFGQFNKDILRIKRNKKEETEYFEKRQIQLKSCKKNMEQAEAVHSRIKSRINKLKKKHEKYSNLLELKYLREKNSTEHKVVAQKVKNLHFPQTEVLQRLSEKIEKFEQLSTHKNTLEKTNFALNRVRGQIKDLKPLSVNLSNLRGKIEQFCRIKSIYEKFSQNRGLFGEITKNIKIVEKEYEVAERNHKRLLMETKEEEISLCPHCNCMTKNICGKCKEIK